MEKPWSTTPIGASRAVRLKRATLSCARHWLALANGAWALYVGLPWLAPVLMHLEQVRAARVLYRIYSFLCHQLADRSFFLFGPRASYSAATLVPQASGGDLQAALRAFVGSPELGYKVAWSDRMVTLYGGVLLGGLVFALFRRRLQAPPWWAPALLFLPLAMDGTTHLISDLLGFNTAFRYTNAWLEALTAGRLAASFYAGNALGSFNSWSRLISGLLAGLAIAWGAYPVFDAYFHEVAAALEGQLAEVGRSVPNVTASAVRDSILFTEGDLSES